MTHSGFQYRVSVIVPIYNVEQFLRDALDSLADQTIPPEEMEVLMVDDGSPDNSIEIMREYAAKHPNFKILRKENGGLSSARNFGIRHANGKYLMYLDADDWYSPETVKSAADFFDAHYDEIDLADIKIVPIRDGKENNLHYRYLTLNETGIYDLTDPSNCYITQTTINICVKNLGQANVLFDENRAFRQEDQKYCTQILQKKMKIGYCDKGVYYYRQQEGSIVHSLFKAYYIFEASMKFWENLFSEYENEPVPQYIQALYLHDINWKTASDILLPYHYPPEEFLTAKRRILKLLNQVDDSVILNHPGIELYRKHFFLSLKSRRDISMSQREQLFTVYDKDLELYSAESVELDVQRLKLRDGKLEMTAVVKSPFFNYYPDKPQLFLVCDNKADAPTILDLRDSSWNYHAAKIKTTSSWVADVSLDLSGVRSFRFVAVVHSFQIPCAAEFDWRIGVHRSEGKPYCLFADNCCLSCHKDTFSIRKKTAKDRLARHIWYLRSHPKTWLKRQLCMAKLKFMPSCWLYYDCCGFGRNNGYFQFDHDFSIGDGIPRYYVINEKNFNEIRKSFPRTQQPFLVRFGSRKHKLLYLSASMLLTAWIEDYNCIPFKRAEFIPLADLCRQHDLVYLQHGVLHAHTPWKYSRDRINVEL